MKKGPALVMVGMSVAVTVYASGGAKKTAEACSDDSECNK
jgi:hypothetical protein